MTEVEKKYDEYWKERYEEVKDDDDFLKRKIEIRKEISQMILGNAFFISNKIGDEDGIIFPSKNKKLTCLLNCCNTLVAYAMEMSNTTAKPSIVPFIDSKGNANCRISELINDGTSERLNKDHFIDILFEALDGDHIKPNLVFSLHLPENSNRSALLDMIMNLLF